MRHLARIGTLGLGLAAVAMACRSDPEEFRELRDGQRQLMNRLGDLEKKIDQVASRPAAAPQGPSQADANRVYSIPVGDSPSKGPSNAPVLLAEFSDFQCPFCSKVPGLVDEVLKAYPKEVKFVYKQYPLTQIHPNAMNAARAALAAHKQGKFWEMHDKLFANQSALQPDKLKEYAGQIGLNIPRFEKDMASSEVQKQIDEESRVADQSGVTGTPTLFVNGRRVQNRSLESLKSMIEDSLKNKT
jgi:protein-disulfide isomerase